MLRTAETSGERQQLCVQAGKVYIILLKQNTRCGTQSVVTLSMYVRFSNCSLARHGVGMKNKFGMNQCYLFIYLYIFKFIYLFVYVRFRQVRRIAVTLLEAW